MTISKMRLTAFPTLTRIWIFVFSFGLVQQMGWTQDPDAKLNPSLADKLSAGPSKDKSKSDDSDLSNEDPDPDAYGDRAAQRFYERVFKRLKKMKLNKEKISKSKGDSKAPNTVSVNSEVPLPDLGSKTKPSLADHFVIGTAAVHPVSQHADVCFRAVAGIDETAREITRFQGETVARGEICYWHVFYRVSPDINSEKLLAQLQKQYDETVAYRNSLMRRYNAVTIRRC